MLQKVSTCDSSNHKFPSKIPFIFMSINRSIKGGLFIIYSYEQTHALVVCCFNNHVYSGQVPKTLTYPMLIIIMIMKDCSFTTFFMQIETQTINRRRACTKKKEKQFYYSTKLRHFTNWKINQYIYHFCLYILPPLYGLFYGTRKMYGEKSKV